VLLAGRFLLPQTPQLILDSIAFERDDSLLFSGICLSLESGDVLQIEGPNGVGKTTLLRILSTALMPTAGKLFWQGSDVARHRQLYLQNIMFLGHLPGLKQSLSPTENLVWWRRIHRDHSPLKNEEILGSLGLCGYEDIPCYALSAGQQRRAVLARLLVTEAPLWILDEPFTAIDKQGVADLEALLIAHARRGGMAVLSTHQDLGIANVRRFPLVASAEVV
jgi:heme exporter protein A